MRFALLLLVVPAFAVAQDGDAEKLFRSLEGKLEKARAVSCAFHLKVGGIGGQGTELKGSCKAGPGERIEVASTLPGGGGGKMGQMKVVVEGGELTLQMGPEGKGVARPVPQGYAKSVRSTITRIGPGAWFIFAGPLGGSIPGKEAGGNSFAPSKFHLGEKTKIGERDAILLEYSVQVEVLAKSKDEKPKFVQDTGSVKLWLDAETKLPLKREVTLPKGGMQLRTVETYSDFKVDEKGAEKRPETDKKGLEKTPPKDSGK